MSPKGKRRLGNTMRNFGGDPCRVQMALVSKGLNE